MAGTCARVVVFLRKAPWAPRVMTALRTPRARKASAACSAVASEVSANAGKNFGLALVGRDIVAVLEDGRGSAQPGAGFEDGGHAEGSRQSLKGRARRWGREFELGDEDGGLLDERAGLLDFQQG